MAMDVDTEKGDPNCGVLDFETEGALDSLLKDGYHTLPLVK